MQRQDIINIIMVTTLINLFHDQFQMFNSSLAMLMLFLCRPPITNVPIELLTNIIPSLVFLVSSELSYGVFPADMHCKESGIGQIARLHIKIIL